MKCLIITMSLPYPPASGGAIRTHGIVEGLHKAGHDVTLMCFHDGPLSETLNPAIRVVTVPSPSRSMSDRLRDLIFSRQPDIARRLYDLAFASALKSLLQETTFDLVQFEGIESICYQPLVAETQPQAKRIFDTFNAEYDLQRTIFSIDRKQPSRWPAALYSYLQIGRIRRYERAMSRLADAVIAVSEEDATLLKVFRDDGWIPVVPSGIWVDRYTQETETPFSSQRNIVFTGKMDYRPNVDAMLWFTEAILPNLQNVHLTIVGQKPHSRLAHLADLHNVTITDWVDSVVPYLKHSDVYIAPLRMGSGTRLKLLEAMACGCAIVATTTASAGLNDATRATMQIVDHTDDFARAITNLLDAPGEREAIATATQSAVRTYYDWTVLVPRMLDVYRKLDLDVE